MVHILAVANSMLEVSDFSVSNLKLQKLLYYVYGVNLVINEIEEISEGPQAWDYGPVFPTVYRKFQRYGADIISMPAVISPFSNLDITNEFGAENSGTKTKYIKEVPTESKLFQIIKSVYNKFGILSEFELVRRTHQRGTTWDKFYQSGKYKVTMCKPTVKKYFKEHVLA